MEAQNQRTGTPADFTAPWCGTVLSEAATAVLYKKAILKNFAMSTGNTRVELLKKLQTFRPATLLERDPSRGVFL